MKVKSYNNNDINDGTYLKADLYPVGQSPAAVEPEVVGMSAGGARVGGVLQNGFYYILRIVILSAADKRTYQKKIYNWFKPEDEIVAALVIEDDDGNNDRYQMALALDIVPVTGGEGLIFEIPMVVDGETDRRATTLDSDTWGVTGTGQTNTITNGADEENVDAYPIFEITPTAAKSGAGALSDQQSFVAVRWLASAAANGYPVDIVNNAWNTSAIISASNMQTDGDDIRVSVDGVDFDYWLDGINTTSTKVWMNLDFQAGQSATLSGSLGAGSLSTLQSSTAINNFPNSGLLEIDSELFSYTGKNNSQRRFTGVTRAAKNTTAVSHSSGSTIYWIQHEILITYGDSTLSAKTVNDDNKPMFNLATSTNSSWDYDSFFESGKSRSGAWAFANVDSAIAYSDEQDASSVNPYQVMGIKIDLLDWDETIGYWRLFNPCGITGANFQNGDSYRGRAGLIYFDAIIQSSANDSSWVDEYTVPDPGSSDVWVGWSQNISSLTSGSKYIRLYNSPTNRPDGTLDGVYVEVGDVTLTLDSSMTPTSNITAGTGDTYLFDFEIGVTETGESIAFNYAVELNETITIDCSTFTATAPDGTQINDAVKADTIRERWLRFVPGSNELTYTELGAQGVAVVTKWRKGFDV